MGGWEQWKAWCSDPESWQSSGRKPSAPYQGIGSGRGGFPQFSSASLVFGNWPVSGNAQVDRWMSGFPAGVQGSQWIKFSLKADCFRTLPWDDLLLPPHPPKLALTWPRGLKQRTHVSSPIHCLNCCKAQRSEIKLVWSCMCRKHRMHQGTVFPEFSASMCFTIIFDISAQLFFPILLESIKFLKFCEFLFGEMNWHLLNISSWKIGLYIHSNLLYFVSLFSVYMVTHFSH